MTQKLNCIMLIDDNKDDNFYHERVIKKHKCVETILAKESGMAAIEYLKNKKNHENAHPDLIFLDINMPGMNGWEFLEEYKKLDKELQSTVIVVMLTTSDNPDDMIKGKNLAPHLKDFRTKPLTKEMLDEVINKFFAANDSAS